jgi:hypothetical protein
MTLSQSVKDDWQPKDQVVVTATDYIPEHSEQFTIATATGNKVTFSPTVRFPHNGTRYDLGTKLSAASSRLGFDPNLTKPLAAGGGAETRASVALLTRSIRIVSGGDAAGVLFQCAKNGDKCAPQTYFFGGQVIFRQGFQSVQIQGVEFAQLGEGGRMGHYAVHFHMARNPPTNTFIKDSSVNESMTRWIVVHSTNGVLLARNVGYKSIGHGFYLEDGTETNNKFYSNIGIDARAAVYSVDNPRQVPGIFAANNMGPNPDAFPQVSDVNHPTVFWITNGWNDFIGNMAVGAGTCGTCYWFIASSNNDMADVGGGHMKWTGYSALQGRIGSGTTPLKSFYSNYCSTAMNSFLTVGATAACNGLDVPSPTPPPSLDTARSITPVMSIAPDFPSPMYYPSFSDNHFPTVCNPDSETASGSPLPSQNACALTPNCAFPNPATCGVTVLDHYTTSFNWADFAFAAVWLRSGWYLMDNSVITDVQNGGLTFVSGGDYTRAAVPEGYWALASHVAFVGATQPIGKYTSAKGPFNNGSSDLSCVFTGGSCLNAPLAIPMQMANFGTNQRPFSIYDGPTYEDSNAFLDINTTPCTDFVSCMYWNTPGIRKDQSGKGYMPNAAIAWKQPNGFYYPPAFHSRNLLFNNVDIRHYVIEPFFLSGVEVPSDPPKFLWGTYLTDLVKVQQNYTGAVSAAMFANYTDVDRQTELNDDDGTLTGLTGTLAPLNQTISVNKDTFFNAPVETDQCRSNLGVDPSQACTGKTPTRATAKTSPYDYVTTAIVPQCALGPFAHGRCGSATKTIDPVIQKDPDFEHNGITYARYESTVFDQGGVWSQACGGPYCFGVPLYRQNLLGDPKNFTEEWATWKANGCDTAPGTTRCQFPFARMAGEGNYQRSVMTLNGGTYYLDTTVSRKAQQDSQALGLSNQKTSVYVECDIKPIGGCQPRSVNTFQGGQTYYVFFIYAKSSTKLVYQIYVGDDFTQAMLESNVDIFQMNIANPWSLNKPTKTWNDAGWKRELIAGPDGKMNVLQVTVDMTAFANNLDPTIATNGTCKPVSFCKPEGNTCICNMPPNDPRLLANQVLRQACTNTCGRWAMKDLDCPSNGCLGFWFKLPTKFESDDKNHRPTPAVFPITGPLAPLLAAKLKSLAGTVLAPDNAAPSKPYAPSSCFYEKVPGTDCPVPFIPN